MHNNLKFQNEVESFLVSSTKKFKHLDMNSNILMLNNILNNRYSQKKIIRKDHIFFLDKLYKAYMNLYPNLKIILKNKKGIITFEIEKKQRSGYHILLEKKIKITPLENFFRHIGTDTLSEISQIKNKDFEYYIDDMEQKFYE